MPSRIQLGPMEQARLRAGLSRTQVADALTRCTTSIRRWELGLTTPPQAVVLRLAQLYGCSPTELVA